MEAESKLVSPALGSVTSSDSKQEIRKHSNSLCEVCNWQGKNKRSLKIHNDISHLNVLKFACGKCKYKSYYKVNVSLHKASVHNIEEDKVIRIGCPFCEEGLEHIQCSSGKTNKKVTRKRKSKVLQSNSKQALLILENNCDHCQFKTSNKTELREHYQREHPGESIFKCDNCEFGSLWRGKIKNHKKIMHKHKKFPCEVVIIVILHKDFC